MASMFQTKRSDTDSSFEGSGNGRSEMTTIAQGVRVEGDFSSQGDVMIEGNVQGTVSVAGRLVIGAHAVLKADVSAEQISIAGSVQGNVTVTSHLDLKATAKVIGDISCATASIESGATVSGRASIGAADMPKKAARQSDAKNGASVSEPVLQS